MVSDDPAQQSSVSCGNSVVLIHVYLGQRADIDFELAACRQAVSQPVVQAVDAFYDKDLALRKTQLVSGKYALSGDKVIRWHTDFPAL